jgi:hypothetical protein
LASFVPDPLRRGIWSATRVLPLVCVAASFALAQSTATADSASAQLQPKSGARVVEGHVVRPGGASMEPVIGAWVTLHRVGKDSAAPMDSVRTSKEGEYRFDYRPFGAEDAIYFVSASYAGIAYFTSPLQQALVSGDDADIQVFDTTSTGINIAVRGRHLILSGGADASRRTLIEVFELTNDSSRTLVGRTDRAPTFTVRVPKGIADFKVAQGDVPADAVSLADTLVQVMIPFAPGLKRLSFTYTLPASAFPLTIPLEHPTEVLEVLAEDPQATVSAAKLAETAPASVEGRNFRRFLGNGIAANTVLTLDVPGAGLSQRTRVLLSLVAGIILAMLFALWRAFSRRSASGTVNDEIVSADREAERLARRIADLDAKHERERAPSTDTIAAYHALA